MTVSGETSDNPFQYTGRENDGTGLYYYRFRYYPPELQRFISEDPVRLLGGDVNFYIYVGNIPTRYTDPYGLGWQDWLIKRFLKCIGKKIGKEFTDDNLITDEEEKQLLEDWNKRNKNDNQNRKNDKRK